MKYEWFSRLFLMVMIGVSLAGSVAACVPGFGTATDSFTNITWAPTGELFFTRLDYGVEEGLWVREADGSLKLLHANGGAMGVCNRAYVVDTYLYQTDSIGVTVECEDREEVTLSAYEIQPDTYEANEIADTDGLASVFSVGESEIGVERIFGENGCRRIHVLDGHERELAEMTLEGQQLGLTLQSDCLYPQIRHEVGYAPTQHGKFAFTMRTEDNGPLMVGLWNVDEADVSVMLEQVETTEDLAFTSDGTYLLATATLSNDHDRAGIVQIDTRTGKYHWVVEADGIDGVAVSPDDKEVVYAVDGEFVFVEMS